MLTLTIKSSFHQNKSCPGFARIHYPVSTTGKWSRVHQIVFAFFLYSWHQFGYAQRRLNEDTSHYFTCFKKKVLGANISTPQWKTAGTCISTLSCRLTHPHPKKGHWYSDPGEGKRLFLACVCMLSIYTHKAAAFVSWQQIWLVPRELTGPFTWHD